MSKEFQKIGDITEAAIKKLKQTRTGVTRITIPLEENERLQPGENASFIICKPTRTHLDAITDYAAKKDIENVNNVLVKNCVFGGDMIYLDKDQGDSQIFATVLEELGNLMQKKRVISSKV